MRIRLIPFFLLLSVQLLAQQVVLNRQRHFPKTVPAGNYSGITWLGGDRYAVANDKSPTAGFYLMTIRTDSVSGKILEARTEAFMTNNQPNRDEEGICYVPHTNTLFVSGERDGQIVEYSMDGRLTGRKLSIPDIFRGARGNRGFEALTYNAVTHRFWTTTENTLRGDGKEPDIRQKVANHLRFQCFDDDLQPVAQYMYTTDSSSVKSVKGSDTYGVSGLVALDDGRLIVLEREIRRTASYVGSFVQVKLYLVDPSKHQQGEQLQKQLLTSFRTRFNLTKRNFANFEGICAGPRLADGRQLLILVADSQNQYKGRLKDWIKSAVITLPY